MIEVKFPYEEEAVANVFKGRRFFLELIAGEKINAVDEAQCFEQVNHMNLTGKKEFWLRVLRTHQPVEVCDFRGCSYFSNMWWVAKVKVSPVTASKVGTVYFLVTGWTNQFHGTLAAITSSSSNGVTVSEWLQERLSGKEERGYSVVSTMQDVPLVPSISLPDIDGLPEIVDIFPEDDPRTTIPDPVIPPRSTWGRAPAPVDPDVEEDPYKVVVPKPARIKEEKKEIKEKKATEKKTKEKKTKKVKKVTSIKEMMASRKKESDW